MELPIIEKLSGQVNGTNVVFETSRGYVPGSTKVFINGLVGLELLTDGWTESGNKIVKLKVPPRVGDVLQIYYVLR